MDKHMAKSVDNEMEAGLIIAFRENCQNSQIDLYMILVKIQDPVALQWFVIHEKCLAACRLPESTPGTAASSLDLSVEQN